MINADKFEQVFGIYATELWAKPEKEFLEWLNSEVQEVQDVSITSAEPRKKGKWIKIPEFCGDDVSGFVDNHFSCSECKKEAEINSWGFYILSDFCPNCGADMRGDSDE